MRLLATACASLSARMRRSCARRGAVQPRIDVAGAGDLEAGKALDRAQRGHNLLRDDLGRFAQLARQFKGDGRGQLAETSAPAASPAESFSTSKIVFCFEHRANALAEPSFAIPDTRREPQKSLIFKVILAPAEPLGLAALIAARRKSALRETD